MPIHVNRKFDFHRHLIWMMLYLFVFGFLLIVYV